MGKKSTTPPTAGELLKYERRKEARKAAKIERETQREALIKLTFEQLKDKVATAKALNLNRTTIQKYLKK